MDQCDFCSNPKVVRRYQCMDFKSESKDAGVRYGKTNLILDSLNFWAACAECARYVDAEDIEGLLGYIAEAHDINHTLDPARRSVFLRHARYTYKLFFQNRIRVVE